MPLHASGQAAAKSDERLIPWNSSIGPVDPGKARRARIPESNEAIFMANCHHPSAEGLGSDQAASCRASRGSGILTASNSWCLERSNSACSENCSYKSPGFPRDIRRYCEIKAARRTAHRGPFSNVVRRTHDTNSHYGRVPTAGSRLPPSGWENSLGKCR